MPPEVFLSLLGDACQFHEGYTDLSASFNNKNPGNLRFAHQNGASQTPANFARFPTFYQGKQAQIAQLALDVKKFNTIADLINSYAPPSENDTQAYVNSVIEFLHWRNVDIAATDPIDRFIANFAKPIVLIAVDNLYNPNDWHSIQQAISLAAAYMTEYAFACVYSGVDLSQSVIRLASPISVNTSIISGEATKQVLSQFNHGEPLNVLIYDGAVMLGHMTPAGGCEYQGVTIAPVSSISSVMYQGPAFTDSTARVLFHELIHELFSLTKQRDSLHEYLIAHAGYSANTWADLNAVFAGNNLNTTQAIAALKVDVHQLSS